MKFKFKCLDEFEKLEKSEIVLYVTKLHDFVKSQQKKLRKVKDKYKKLKGKTRKDEAKKKTEEESSDDSEGQEQRKEECNTFPESTKAPVHQPASFVDEIRQAAENIQNENGFVYEPTSGLYYDRITGYYYNAELGLYYDGNTGCYYKFNVEENKFEFHSQVATVPAHEQTAKRPSLSENSSDCSDEEISRRRQRKKTRNARHVRRKEEKDREDGELSSRSEEEIIIVEDYPKETRYEDVAKKYPPSLRIIVLETNLPKLKVGELFIVTYKGGTLGREGTHDVIIPDINVSKYHLKFTYNDEKSGYECVDLGSRNGTLMNGKRISNAKQESDPVLVIHGCSIQLSQTKLLCHVHDGHITCRDCEPGLIKVQAPTLTEENTDRSSKLTHKEELKKIKKRYGLADENYVIPQQMKNDRAAQRRKAVGSTGINEKTMTASVDTSISVENKGFKMLSKLGWSQGQTLGKNQGGLLEPIPLQSNEGTKGLGCEEKTYVTDKRTEKKNQLLKITQQRYKNTLPTNKNVFGGDESSSD
ncbi:Angiogenic factor with G patch and FHA domains 1 [Pseudolycoriella hygida]|uniref:Angiogenic factor with G patch and FHA domains 1 n=1 Tax=Pseudolycoriella hygida TaxID=35572 RepID=A0A9Q0N0D7_9DIPT|nr:Angiogenic factor with G patch and FHA domains 1 [Pseudolycoriella hygida]